MLGNGKVLEEMVQLLLNIVFQHHTILNKNTGYILHSYATQDRVCSEYL